MLLAPTTVATLVVAMVAATVVMTAVAASVALPLPHAYSQSPDLGLATFHETLLLLVDRTGSQNVTASVTLQSISTAEMQVPPLLEQKIREDGRILAVILTNQERCVLGVTDQSCILINMERDPADRGIGAVQESAKETAGLYIDELNDLFQTDAVFHSVYVHPGDSAAQDAAAGLSTTIAGRITVSVVYVMPMEDTNSMYNKISSILIPGKIRDKGGFYDVAEELSNGDAAKFSFSIIPLDSTSLMQVKMITTLPVNASSADVIRPIEMLGLDRLERSAYFASGFYPLNSVVQVVVSSASLASVSDTQIAILPTRIVDGEKLPTDVAQDGWIFDPDSGRLIQGKYIFGTLPLLFSGDLEFSIEAQDKSVTGEAGGGANSDEQIFVVVAVVVAAAAAAAFYLRGYASSRGRSDK